MAFKSKAQEKAVFAKRPKAPGGFPPENPNAPPAQAPMPGKNFGPDMDRSTEKK